jgi:hypothetical protein
MSFKRDKKTEEKLQTSKWNKYSWEVIPLKETLNAPAAAFQEQIEAIEKAEQERELFPVTPAWKTKTGQAWY